MTSLVLQTAFGNVAGHLSNLELMRDLVNEIKNQDMQIDAIIEILEEKSKDAEATLRTDIRILINECRHLKSRMTSR